MSSIPAVVLGATGYVGGELLRLIAGHPNFDLLAAVSESRAGDPVADVFAHLFPAYGDTPFAAHDTWLDRVEPGSQLALFSAAPHGASAAMIAKCLAAVESKNIDVHIVDASADFRYADQAAYEAVYGTPHGAPQLLDAFVCAVPEHLADTDAQHVGHPGCFATAILLAAVPLLQSGLTKAELFVTGITGSTGSGRSLQPGTHHPERHSNLYAYKPLVHRHAPEIASLAAAASGRETQVNFVPHSGPYARGIFATIQTKATTSVSFDELLAVFEHTYANTPFVRITDGSPKLKNVVASNMCEV
ncbi:MAG: N-acetyl-gamma-glutamyl-phosphate reductase, partial [Woeseiaceae bacterium]|nr:N-acetyl-gamma-glutamyl-phosphate reductase [Woeseiaceae bacterium]